LSNNKFIGFRLERGSMRARREILTFCRVCIVASIVVLMPSSLSAETLRDALASAYTNSPKLKSARATLRAADEDVARANAGFRPTAAVRADAGYQKLTSRPDLPSTAGETNPYGYGASASLQVFSGFRTVNAVNEADALVRAERENLRNVEQTLFLDVVTAYADLARDARVEKLRSDNVSRLNQRLADTKARLKQGQITRTDLDQAKLRLAGATSQLTAARGATIASRANFERLVGRPPRGKLAPPALDHLQTPKTIDSAVAISALENPMVASAVYREQAARFVVDKIRGELLPTAQIDATIERDYEPSPFIERQTTGVVRGSVTMPLYTGGEVEARVRQAKELQVGRLQDIHQARSDARSAVRQAWSQVMAANQQLQYDQQQIAASIAALEGVRKEERFGQRSVLDVLNAELEALNAELNLTFTKRNLTVGRYALLAAMGRLTMPDLGVLPMVYDPEAHYNEVRRKWGGLSITYADGRQESLDTMTRTPATKYSPGQEKIEMAQ
jgi:outer membrane protein